MENTISYDLGTGAKGFLTLTVLWVFNLVIRADMGTFLMILGSFLYAANQGYIFFNNFFKKKIRRNNGRPKKDLE